MLMSVSSASTFWALTSVVVYHSSGLALSRPSPIIDEASSAGSSTPWWFTTLIYTALAACVIHFFGILLWMTRLESHVDDKVYQSLPMPCTTTSRRSTSPSPQCLAEKRAVASLSSAAAGPQLYHASREGSVSTPTTPPTRTDTLHSGVMVREEFDDGIRRSRKDTRSPSPHPRTPAASPSPVRPRKRPGRKHCRNSAQQSQERPIEAPQVIRCSSSSSPPFSTIRTSSV
ncbi:hypothetical protein BC629DRAFT_448644 [Irpex lacteus]|nr:hypothetical protein BC629DRAFT_448644 [Irpex lacteus]